MHTVLADPELSRQIFENAVAVTAICFIVLAAAVTLLVFICVVWECVSLTRGPAQSEFRQHGLSCSRVLTNQIQHRAFSADSGGGFR
jgi:hypothetical protein